jgi:DNA repair exonuclease SbcCD ATPase subunit
MFFEEKTAMAVDIDQMRNALRTLGARGDMMAALDELERARDDVQRLESELADERQARTEAETKLAEAEKQRDAALLSAVDAHKLPIVTAFYDLLRSQYQQLIDEVEPIKAAAEVNTALANVATRARQEAEAENARLQKQLATLRGKVSYLQAVQIAAALPEDLAAVNALLTAVSTNFGYTNILDLFGHYAITPPAVYGIHPMQRKRKGGGERDPNPSKIVYAA